MSAIHFMYLSGYAQAEADALAQLGLSISISDRPAPGRTVLRGPKMKPAEYRAEFKRLEALGVRPTTTPDNYADLSDADRYERLVPEHVPPKQIMPLRPEAEAASALGRLAPWGGVFIRSELGSAAKAAGLEACMIDTFTPEAILPKVEVLSAAFPVAERLIARKVMSVRLEANGRAEGRFVVLSGRVAYLDHCELEAPDSVAKFAAAQRDHAEEVASAFRAAGIVGDYFLDIAETTAGSWFVVEIKPLFNGTIRNLEGFAASLR